MKGKTGHDVHEIVRAANTGDEIHFVVRVRFGLSLLLWLSQFAIVFAIYTIGISVC
jgi:hypothetical protein